MNREQLEDLKAKSHDGAIAAKRSLGKALLFKGPEVQEARRALAAAKQRLEDAEAMLLAHEDLEEPERLWDEEVAWKTMPRVALAEYQAAKKRFEHDYEKLKDTPTLLVRGKELAALAKTSGETEISNCKAFLSRFGSSQELHNLLS